MGFNAEAWGIMNPVKMKFMDLFPHSSFISTKAQEEGMFHFFPLQDLVKDGIREGVIRNTDPGLVFLMMASSLSGLIARASSMENPAYREKIIGMVSIIYGTE